MSRSPAQIFRKYLLDLELGRSNENGDWPVYVSYMPDDREIGVIAITNTTPTTDGRYQRVGTTVQHAGLQFRIRDLDPVKGYNKALEIEAALDAVYRNRIEVESSVYLIQAAHHRGINDIGVHDERFHSYTINAVATIKIIS